jgi:hypothetical protein
VSGPLFVHFTASFFADLDRQLPASRRSQVPLRADFLDQELSGIREWFSTRFADLPPAVPGRTDYRQLITSGRVVAAMAVVGQLMPNGTVEILELELSLDWPENLDDEPEA